MWKMYRWLPLPPSVRNHKLSHESPEDTSNSLIIVRSRKKTRSPKGICPVVPMQSRLSMTVFSVSYVYDQIRTQFSYIRFSEIHYQSALVYAVRVVFIHSFFIDPSQMSGERRTCVLQNVNINKTDSRLG